MPQRVLESGIDAVRRVNRRSGRVLSLVGRIRPDERREALGALLTLLGFMAGHALLETARDALFLARLSALRLPWVYLAIALLALALGQREPRVVRRLSAGGELSRWLVAAGLVTLGFWVAVAGGRAWVYYALYVWSGVLASLVVVRFWTILASRYTVAQAKRVFPVIASGSVAGAIAGSALARLLTTWLDARHLVLAAGLVFLTAAWAPHGLEAGEPPARRSAGVADLGVVARTVWGEVYLRRVAVLVLLAAFTFTLVDYVFKSAADRLVAPAELGAFFSSVYLVLNLLSLALQVGGVAWILRHVGVVSAVAIVPAILLVPTLGFAIGGGLALALALKGADGTLRHSLYRTGTELLFVPLSERLRTQVKGVIDVLGQRGGQALASIVILMVLSTTARESVFAGIACVTATAWLVTGLRLREPYFDLFRQTLLQDGSASRPGRDVTVLDTASLETLLTMLNSPDERRVVAALELLRGQGKSGVVPALVLYHPSSRVVVEALELFQTAAREDVVPLVERLVRHADVGVRVAAVRCLSALRPERPMLDAAAEDDAATVRVTALAALVSCGWLGAEEGRTRLLAELATGDASAHAAAARAIQIHAHADLEPVLCELLAEEDPEVLIEAVRAAREMWTPGLLDPLIGLFARRTVRDELRACFAAFGPMGLDRLGEALRDPGLPHAVRRHVPGAVALVGTPRAAEILLEHLGAEPDGMIRFKILRALGRWRAEQPHLALDAGKLRDALSHALATGFRWMGWRRALDAGAVANPELDSEIRQVLAALMRDKEGHALERAFRLLDLRSGGEEFLQMYRSLHSPRRASRDGTRELLPHLVLPPIRRPLLTIVEDLHGDGRSKGEEWPREAPSVEAYAGILSEIIGCGLESPSSLAATHAAELGLRAVLPALERCAPLSEEHATTLRRAVEHLRGAAA
ncbi:MAG TPA: hypothetical protein VK849_08295 [Longimicrobiales bacterium]|nr:hypothetical protein [Longimicrobiales bacterium]